MPNITLFNTQRPYIFLPFFIQKKDGKFEDLVALLDTGAPKTEFSDEALKHLGFLKERRDNIDLKQGLQTQKYGKIVLPSIKICSHEISNLDVYISHFEKSWGIDALIGLDFFRQFRVTIDYKKGSIISEPY